MSRPVLRRSAVREISTAVADRDEALSPESPGGEPERTGDVEADLQALRAYEEQRRERGSFADRWESWEEYADEEGLPLRPRVPGRALFFSVADEALGAPRPYRGVPTYTIPDPTTGGSSMTNLYTEEEISKALEVREIVARLREQEQRLRTPRDAGGRFASTGTGTGTDGTVVPLRRA